jgi:hypothetical protein
MTHYVVIWRSYDTAETMLTDVYLPDDLEPDALTDDNWINIAGEREEDDLEDHEKSPPHSVLGYDLIAVLRGPITLIR